MDEHAHAYIEKQEHGDVVSTLLPPPEDKVARRRRERSRTGAIAKALVPSRDEKQPINADGAAQVSPKSAADDATEGVKKEDGMDTTDVTRAESADKMVDEEDDGEIRDVVNGTGEGNSGKIGSVGAGDEETARDEKREEGSVGGGTGNENGTTVTESNGKDLSKSEEGNEEDGAAMVVVASKGKGGDVAGAGSAAVVPAVETEDLRDVDVYKRDIAWLRSAQGMVAEVGSGACERASERYFAAAVFCLGDVPI